MKKIIKILCFFVIILLLATNFHVKAAHFNGPIEINTNSTIPTQSDKTYETAYLIFFTTIRIINAILFFAFPIAIIVLCINNHKKKIKHLDSTIVKLVISEVLVLFAELILSIQLYSIPTIQTMTISNRSHVCCTIFVVVDILILLMFKIGKKDKSKKEDDTE